MPRVLDVVAVGREDRPEEPHEGVLAADRLEAADREGPRRVAAVVQGPLERVEQERRVEAVEVALDPGPLLGVGPVVVAEEPRRGPLAPLDPLLPAPLGAPLEPLVDRGLLDPHDPLRRDLLLLPPGLDRHDPLGLAHDDALDPAPVVEVDHVGGARPGQGQSGGREERRKTARTTHADLHPDHARGPRRVPGDRNTSPWSILAAMLDPRDRSFLDAAVARGRVTRERAEVLAQRYRGLPGGLGRALVGLGELTPEECDAIERDLSDAIAGAASPQRPSPAGAPHAAWVPRGLPEIDGYALEGELGRGGMGIVYRGRRAADGAPVAVKVLIQTTERHERRFRREARALQRLDHPHIVPLLEAGLTSAARPFIAMPLQEGGDLQAALGRIDRRTALDVLAKVARAVDYAHAHDVLHRDLKPGNVLLSAAGAPLVTDFGLSKIVDRESHLTRTGTALGTPAYMAPEQVRGLEITSAVDAWSLGVLLFRLLTGTLPWSGQGAELLRKVVYTPAPTPSAGKPDVPRDLDDLVAACLDKAPGGRPRCREVAAALEAHLAGAPSRVVPRAVARRRRRRLLVGLNAAAAVLVVATVGLLVGLRLADDEGAGRLEDLRAAVARAEAARSGDALADRLAEASALRDAAAAFADLPPGPTAAARTGFEPARARARRAELLAGAVPALLADGRPDEARVLASERVRIAPGPASDLLLARALATGRPDRGAAARLAAGVAAGAGDARRRAAAADLLLRLGRADLAAEALAGVEEPALRLRRGRALLALRRSNAARADLRAALPDPGAALDLARARLAAGDPAAALEALDAAGRDAGAAGPAAGLRGRALAASGRPAAARTAFAAADVDEAARAARARFHLAAGRRAEAVADLTGLSAPAARLDRAVAAWLGGAPPDATAAELAALADAAARGAGAGPIGAAAARWLARIELARTRPRAAAAAAELARDLEPDARSAACLARCRRRQGDVDAALAALDSVAAGRDAAVDALRARLLLDAGRAAEAEALLPGLPEGVERADLARRVALRHNYTSELAEAERSAFDLRHPARGGALALVPAPIASEAGSDAVRAAVRWLYAEARRVPAGGPPELAARRRALLERVAALDPDHAPARLDLARDAGDLAAIERLVRARPHLPAVRRVRIAILDARADGRAPARELIGDVEVLAEATDPTAADRVRCALALEEAGRLPDAWTLLEPLFATAPRLRPAFEVGLRIARRLGEDARAAELADALAEVDDARRRYGRLLRQARPGDLEDLPAAAEALAVLERNVPHDDRYHWARANYSLAAGRMTEALVSAASVVHDPGPHPWPLPPHLPYWWTYAYGYTDVLRRDVVEAHLAGLRREGPTDPVPWLAWAMHLGARYRGRPADERDPADLEEAGLACLRALAGDPSPGALALAADTLIDLGDRAEAAHLVTLARARDPDCGFAVFQAARLAALEHRTADAVALAGEAGPPDRGQAVGYSFARDPAFAAIRETQAFQEFLARRRRR